MVGLRWRSRSSRATPRASSSSSTSASIVSPGSPDRRHFHGCPPADRSTPSANVMLRSLAGDRAICAPPPGDCGDGMAGHSAAGDAELQRRDPNNRLMKLSRRSTLWIFLAGRTVIRRCHQPVRDQQPVAVDRIAGAAPCKEARRQSRASSATTNAAPASGTEGSGSRSRRHRAAPRPRPGCRDIGARNSNPSDRVPARSPSRAGPGCANLLIARERSDHVRRPGLLRPWRGSEA